MNHSPPAPIDVRLMNLTTSLLVTVLALGCVAAGMWWFVRYPAFAIRQITVDGDTTHNSAASLRASVEPRLAGTFFTVDLATVQAAFQSTPWVRSAMVRREFPDQLRVTLQEYVPVARWGEGDARMLDSLGQVFEAGSDEDDDLPTLTGPDGHAPEVLAVYRLLAPLAAPLGMRLNEVDLLARGNWRAGLDAGAAVELGQGAPAELAARFRQFAATAKEVAARHARPVQAIESADLRYAGGYALRLRGVSTVRADAASQPARAAADQP